MNYKSNELRRRLIDAYDNGSCNINKDEWLTAADMIDTDRAKVVVKDFFIDEQTIKIYVSMPILWQVQTNDKFDILNFVRQKMATALKSFRRKKHADSIIVHPAVEVHARRDYLCIVVETAFRIICVSENE